MSRADLPFYCEHRGCDRRPAHVCETCKRGWCEPHADMRGRKCGAPDCKPGCEGEDCVECWEGDGPSTAAAVVDGDAARERVFNATYGDTATPAEYRWFKEGWDACVAEMGGRVAR